MRLFKIITGCLLLIILVGCANDHVRDTLKGKYLDSTIEFYLSVITGNRKGPDQRLKQINEYMDSHQHEVECVEEIVRQYPYNKDKQKIDEWVFEVKQRLKLKTEVEQHQQMVKVLKVEVDKKSEFPKCDMKTSVKKNVIVGNLIVYKVNLKYSCDTKSDKVAKVVYGLATNKIQIYDMFKETELSKYYVIDTVETPNSAELFIK